MSTTFRIITTDGELVAETPTADLMTAYASLGAVTTSGHVGQVIDGGAVIAEHIA